MECGKGSCSLEKDSLGNFIGKATLEQRGGKEKHSRNPIK